MKYFLYHMECYYSDGQSGPIDGVTDSESNFPLAKNINTVAENLPPYMVLTHFMLMAVTEINSEDFDWYKNRASIVSEKVKNIFEKRHQKETGGGGNAS